eukprot:scaffold8112_cov136-Isochrysis_galbana.AAC.2
MSRKRKVMGTQGWLWPHHRPSTIFAMGPGYCNKYALSMYCAVPARGVCVACATCCRCQCAPVAS